MMPKHNDCPSRNLPTAIKNKLDNSIEVSFAGCNVPRVDVIRLKPGEEQLTRCNVVAI